jgi:adenylosuccinate synthase
VRLSGIEHLALTKLDVLAGLDVIKICVGYRLGGKVLDELPVDPEDLQHIVPVYEELPGWPAEATSAGPARSRGDLPVPAQRYLDRVRELVGLPFALVSLGPGREETILEHELFGVA